MICITKVEVMNVSEVSHAEFLRCKMEDPNCQKRPTYNEFVEWEREVVMGTKFKNGRGETVVLGARKDVEEILGLPFDVFARQINRIEELRFKLNKYHYMTPWQLIKLAFRRWNNQRKGMVI